MRRLHVSGLVLGILAMFVAAVLFTGSDTEQLSAEELIRLTEASHPRWDSYQEDIKGQIGAAPVAHWQGAPRRVRVEDGITRVDFEIRGPWTTYNAAVPILLRGPGGATHRQNALEFDDGTVIYIFGTRDEPAIGHNAPWILVKYPHHEKRLPLSPEGTWEAE